MWMKNYMKIDVQQYRLRIGSRQLCCLSCFLWAHVHIDPLVVFAKDIPMFVCRDTVSQFQGILLYILAVLKRMANLSNVPGPQPETVKPHASQRCMEP